jgi:hypothetical protein
MGRLQSLLIDVDVNVNFVFYAADAFLRPCADGFQAGAIAGGQVSPTKARDEIERSYYFNTKR